ncbi:MULTISPECIES: OmpW/AlkL family protein [unclassified Acinetobacter]|uniref:OmpW/AlkL family protein n=1 Tax=unclassified Acinetobacter TaxID=196816 RepID=UPI00190B2485|nr:MULTISPECIES: OmpW family protein [unclassified Acinetobacter]MBK0062084.1 OmpW family protein [Acinetobacter sp. S55]MBK0065888.1 OmpW family protein [Acinetobacter sp. S54]
MKIITLCKQSLLAVSITSTFGLVHADDFKRFSVSAGWLHVMPQGKANPFDISTSVPSGTNVAVGEISIPAFLGALDPDASFKDGDGYTNTKFFLNEVFKKEGDASSVGELLGFVDENGNVNAETSGVATINGIDHWQNEGSGLEADDVDTLGLTFNYYLNENVSLQFIGGIPPKVDINGKGFIKAPLTGSAKAGGLAGQILPDIALKQDIPITNLDAYGKAASVRAWTPALEAQYQWGKAGVNKFRPYVGAGVMYAHFSDIKLNSGIRSDLEAAGHMIQNIHDGQAGAALDGKKSSANPVVDVDADDAIAPIVTAGFTYDITPNWYTVASVSYAKLNNKATINVIDSNTNRELIHSSTKMDIDPIITYLGVGYRF